MRGRGGGEEGKKGEKRWKEGQRRRGEVRVVRSEQLKESLALGQTCTVCTHTHTQAETAYLKSI